MTTLRFVRFITLTTLAAGTIATTSFAQDASDVLRYSLIQPSGTARALGFGNALGSIGGDFTSISINPAGIGIYRRSEMMFTPSIKANNYSGSYLNETNDVNTTRFNFNNIGIVFTQTPRGKRYETSDWKAISFAIGVNRLADFNRDYTYSGLNKNTSFSQVFLNDAIDHPENLNNSSSLAYLGYNSFLLDKDSLGYFALPYEATTDLHQKRNVQERGSMNELAFSLGGNYQEKLMLGATVSIPIVNYRRKNYFEEVDASGNANNYFQAFRYSEDLQSSGIGFVLKLGAIYKPTDWMRIGVALHTPTWLAMSDVYNQSITTNTEQYKQTFYPGLDNPGPITTIKAPTNNFDYTIRTPWRAVFSATTMIGKHGFLTADYELVDYSSARLGFSSDYSQEQNQRNQDIKNTTKTTGNFRIGAEGHINQIYLRAGYGFYGSPYLNNNSKMNRTGISGGIGYRVDNLFVDFGWMHTRFTETEQPYTLPNTLVPSATMQNRLNNIALTFGFKL